MLWTQTTPLDIEDNRIEIVDSLSLAEKPIDSLVKEPLLLDKVKYTAKEKVNINRRENKLYLIDEAELYYQDITLKAGIIVLDYKTKDVYAGRIADSLGELSQFPYFKQGPNEVNPDSIRYNFETQKALIWNSKTAQSGMNVYSAFTKKENDSVYYLSGAKVTTAGDLESADYYFKTRKAKLIPGGKIVTGLTNMYIFDVPTPIALPFSYFPSNQELASGFLFPSISENNNRGYAIQNGGYYFNLSEYFNLALTGDYFTNGSYGMRFDTSYKKRYKYNGTLSFRFENLVSGERGLPGYSKSTVSNLRWSHSKDPKSSPNSTFSASVNYGSSDYYQQSVNQLNSPNFLNNNLSSSISYSKTFPKAPRVNLSLTTALSQNSRTKLVNLTLPTLQANLDRIFPFAPKDRPKKGFIQNINFQYSTQAEQRLIVQEDQLFKTGMFDKAKAGVRHTIPVSTNFKLFKYISVSTNANYNEVWSPRIIRYNDYDPVLGAATKDTLSKFSAFRQYSFGASFGTTIYGTINFKKNSRIQSIRHTLRPSITYSNNPSFDQYYDEYIIDADGNTREYTRFENSLYGTPSRGFSSSIGISLSNNFEAKVIDKDTTKTELKKIKLLNNLNLSTSYNMVADSLNLAPIRMTSGLNILKNKMRINFGATFDPYAINENNQRIGTYHIANGGGLARMTSANINMSYNINNDTFKRGERDLEEEEEEENTEITSSGGRDDDLFGRSANLYNRQNNMALEDEEPPPEYPYFKTKIPWSLKFAYSLTYNNRSGQRDLSTNSLMFSGDINLTPKWTIGISSGYDFKQEGFTYTQFRFDRDLDSWKMNFSWVPFSQRASWNFFIGIKSGMLSDIKYEKNSEPYRNL
tara:strand:+ start:112399 stop:114990 length:2592 start_codon:yes stop_codon:yes gene_type:complete